jgi:hypothetical protein
MTDLVSKPFVKDRNDDAVDSKFIATRLNAMAHNGSVPDDAKDLLREV